MDLYSWQKEDNLKVRVAQVLRRYKYHVQDKKDHVAYNRLCAMITKLSTKLKTLRGDDPFRIAMTDPLLQKLSNFGIVFVDRNTASGHDADRTRPSPSRSQRGGRLRQYTR